MASFLGKTIPVALAVVCALSGHPAFAQSATTPTPPPQQQKAPGPDFATHQQKELAHIGQRIQIMQTLQSCIQSATDHAGMKTCNETARQSEQALRH